MDLEDVKNKARKVFDMWFDIFSKPEDKENKEKLFEYFYSGYLAGTKYKPGDPVESRPVNIIHDDINRNFDL